MIDVISEDDADVPYVGSPLEVTHFHVCNANAVVHVIFCHLNGLQLRQKFVANIRYRLLANIIYGLIRRCWVWPWRFHQQATRWSYGARLHGADSLSTVDALPGILYTDRGSTVLCR